jgi:hypothetical protein
LRKWEHFESNEVWENVKNFQVRRYVSKSKCSINLNFGENNNSNINNNNNQNLIGQKDAPVIAE